VPFFKKSASLEFILLKHIYYGNVSNRFFIYQLGCIKTKQQQNNIMIKPHLEEIPFDKVTVYPESLQERINAGNFSRVDGHEDFHKFLSNVEEEYNIFPKIIKITGDTFFESEELVKLMEKQGFRPANFYELLAFRRFNKNYPMHQKMHIISDLDRVSIAGYKSPTLYRTTKENCELLITYHSTQLQQGSKVLFVKVV